MARQASSSLDPAAPAPQPAAAGRASRRVRQPVAGAALTVMVSVVIAVGAPSKARAAGELLASVVGASGEAVVIRAGGPALPPRAGMMLGAGDRLVTRTDGRVTMRLGDGTLVALHPNTDITLDAKALQAEAPRGLLALMRSALRTVSEALGRRAPGEARPQAAGGATIGRRSPAPAPAAPVAVPTASAQVCAAPGCAPATVRLAAGPPRDEPPPR